MALTLAEKYPHDPYSMERPPCELETPSATSSNQDRFDEPSDVHVASLLAATMAVIALTTLLWLSLSAIKWSFRRLLLTLSGRNVRGVRLRDEEPEDDDSATIFGSPLTPPPNGWLHDLEDINQNAYTTPQPPEPLLFSLTPALGSGGGGGGGGSGGAYGAHGAQARMRPGGTHLPTMQSVAGLAGGFGGLGGAGIGTGPGTAGRSCVGLLAGSPDGVGALQRRRGPGARGGGGCGSGGGAVDGHGGGWDPALLARQAALLPAISSVEGLMASAEFQEHVRSTRRRSAFLERDQSQAKVQLYKDLRRLDPDAFRRLMSREDIQTYEARPPPVVWALVDYLVGAVGVPLALATYCGSQAAAGSPLLRYGLPCVWLAARLRLAAAGHTNLLGRLTRVYLVYDVPDDAEPGNAWEGLAGIGGHVLLALFELLMAGLSLGLLGVAALVSIAVSPRRQTLAMRLLGLRLEQEVCRPTKLSPFSPSSDPLAATTSKTSSQRDVRSFRYGLSHS